ncbi:MAG: aspartate aminotransferase [Gammaproteobacteria bacterium]|jgi:aspartate aminotransferase
MPPALSSLTQSLGSSAVVAFRRIADELQARGIDIVDLGIGEPDAHSPKVAVDAMVQALRQGHDKYLDPRGLLALREAIVNFEQGHHQVPCEPEQIVVTTGSVGALSLATRALFGPGDEVLLPEPCYGPYRNQLRLTGAVPVGVPMPVNGDRIELDAEALRAALTDRTKGIIINTPWNPVGRVFTREELLGVAALAEEANLWVISDEVYSELTYEPFKHLSIASLGSDVSERTVTVNSVSKSFAMTGWRLGYCIANREVADVLSAINHLTTRCATSFVQFGAAAAYTDALANIEQQRAKYAQRRDTIVDALSNIDGLHPVLPEGTFYAFARFPEALGDSREVAQRLLQEHGVVVTPGSAYGPSSKHYLRLSFATSEDTIREGARRIGKFFFENS